MSIIDQFRRLAWTAPVLLALALMAPPGAQAAATADRPTTARNGAPPGTLAITMEGGMAIYGGGAKCSLGFNLRQGTTKVFVTAGHCTNISSSWYSAGGVYLGNRVGTSFPGNDYGLVRYANTSVSSPSSVHLYPGSQSITSIGTPTVYQEVRASGAGSGLRSGRVLALGVPDPSGTVLGLIKTNICSTGGDSGGPLFGGTVGYGILSYASGIYPTCVSYFQPLTEVAAVYGLTL